MKDNMVKLTTLLDPRPLIDQLITAMGTSNKQRRNSIFS